MGKVLSVRTASEGNSGGTETLFASTAQKPLNGVGHPVDEPIAIVGMGCRYPGGVVDAESFWRLLDGGIDAIGEVPSERWDIDSIYDPDPSVVGKMSTRFGGFLSGIDGFDPGFFGIAPREAMSLDPQQRLLLETSWEALEQAGITTTQLSGSSTGVFVGMSQQEYGTLARGLDRLDGYVGTGSFGKLRMRSSLRRPAPPAALRR